MNDMVFSRDGDNHEWLFVDENGYQHMVDGKKIKVVVPENPTPLDTITYTHKNVEQLLQIPVKRYESTKFKTTEFGRLPRESATDNQYYELIK